MNKLSLSQEAGVELVRSAAKSLLNPRGHFKVEHWRNGKRINEYVFPNGITNEGKNKLLNVMFHGTTAVATWWLGLVDNSGYTALAATDTYDDINQVANGWDEFTSYTDAGNGGSASTRPQWNEGAASGQSITNSSPAVFDLTGCRYCQGRVPGRRRCGIAEQGRPHGWQHALGDRPVHQRRRGCGQRRPVEGHLHRQCVIKRLPRQGRVGASALLRPFFWRHCDGFVVDRRIRGLRDWRGFGNLGQVESSIPICLRYSLCLCANWQNWRLFLQCQ